MIIIKLENLSHSLQLKMKQSSTQHHELKKYLEFTVNKKPDKFLQNRTKFLELIYKFFLTYCSRLKFKYKSWKNSNISFAEKNIFIKYMKHVIMNFVLNFLQIYIHVIFIIIYLQIKCFRNFPTFLLQFQPFVLYKKKIQHL